MKKVLQDVADVTIRDKETGMVVATTEAQMSSISQTISEEDLRGGIGNGRVFLIRSDKTIDLTLRSATFDPLYLAITQGVEAVKDKLVNVTRVKVGEVNDEGEIVLPYTPVQGETITARSIKTGTQIKLDYSTVTPLGGNKQGSTIKIPKATDLTEENKGTGLVLEKGDKVTITYKISVVGDSITFDSSKFSKKYEVEYRTIAYDQDTGRPDTELYFIFPEAIPSGEFDMSLENGSVYTPEFNLSVTAPSGSTEMGQFISVRVGELDEEGNPILPETGNEIEDDENKQARAELKTEITRANQEVADTKTSTDGSDVPSDEQWVTQLEKDALIAAIATAQSVADEGSSTKQELETSKTTLVSAIDTFTSAKQDGTM